MGRWRLLEKLVTLKAIVVISGLQSPAVHMACSSIAAAQRAQIVAIVNNTLTAVECVMLLLLTLWGFPASELMAAKLASGQHAAPLIWPVEVVGCARSCQQHATAALTFATPPFVATSVDVPAAGTEGRLGVPHTQQHPPAPAAEPARAQRPATPETPEGFVEAD